VKERIFLDNDIILDVSAEREVDVSASVRLLNLASKGIFNGFVSALTFTNAHYVQRKLEGREASINFLKELRLILRVLSVDDSIIESALESGWKDFEDSVQYFTALQNGIDCIITQNKDDYKKSKIPVYTPAEFLETKGIKNS
jgi:predicted nucleic acid-binding protein